MIHKTHVSRIRPDDHYVTLHVRPKDYQVCSARYRWYCRAKEFHGKTLAAFKQSVLVSPPSIPASGKREPIAGWLRYLVDEAHVIELKTTTRKV